MKLNKTRIVSYFFFLFFGCIFASTIFSSNVSAQEKALFSISGVVYTDVNNNGVQDKNESGIPNAAIVIHSGTSLTQVTTSSNGTFFHNPSKIGLYQVIYNSPEKQKISKTILLAAFNAKTVVNFPLNKKSQQVLFQVGETCSNHNECDPGEICECYYPDLEPQVCAIPGSRGEGAFCCDPRMCQSGLQCIGGECTRQQQQCGGQNEPCCGPSETCDPGFVCTSIGGRTCQPCGGLNQFCCSEGRCNNNLMCKDPISEPICVPQCGNLNQSCCAGNTCNEPSILACKNNACVQCGQQAGQPCCEGVCYGVGLTCNSSTNACQTQQTYRVSGSVYIDKNRNRVKDPGEPGKGGIRINVNNTEVTTQGDGSYSYTLPSAGNYSVCIISSSIPTGYEFADTSSCLTIFVTNTNPVFTDKNFAIARVFAISGFVFNDLNGDGIYNPGPETGRPNTPVRITGPESNTPSTNQNGFYSSQFLRTEGTYQIEIDIPSGFRITNPPNPKSIPLSEPVGDPTINFGIAQAPTNTPTVTPTRPPTATPTSPPTATPTRPPGASPTPTTPPDTTSTPTRNPNFTPTPTTPPGSPTQTPTFPPGSTTVALSVTLPGIGRNIGDNLNPRNPSRKIQVTVLNSENQVVKNAEGSVSFDGSKFNGVINLGTDLPSRPYILKVRLENTLWKRVPGFLTITSGQHVSAQTIQLVLGDTNDDNKLDLSDYNRILSCFSGTRFNRNIFEVVKTYAAVDFLCGSDFNDDGMVEEKDVNIFLRGLAIREGD